MSAEAYSFIQNEFPGKLSCLELKISDFKTFRYRKRRKSKKPRKQKTNAERYGNHLTTILDWLDENCNDLYFPKKDNVDRHTKEATIKFYFIEESDAMAFKLTFS